MDQQVFTLGNLINIIASVVIVGSASVLIKMFISRAFNAIDTKMNEMFSWVNNIDKTLRESEKEIIKLHERTKDLFHIREQVSILDKTKLDKTNFIEEVSSINHQLETIADRIDILYSKLLATKRKNSE